VSQTWARPKPKGRAT